MAEQTMTKDDLRRFVEGIVGEAAKKRADEFDAYVADATREVAGDDAADEMADRRARARRETDRMTGSEQGAAMREFQRNARAFRDAAFRGELSQMDAGQFGSRGSQRKSLTNVEALPWQAGRESLDQFGRGHNFAASLLLYARAKSEGRSVGGLMRTLTERGELAKTRVAELLQTRTVAASSATSGGWLIEEEFVSDYIPALYASSVVLQSGVMTMDLSTGEARIPKQTGSSTAYWVGENGAITKSEITGGDVKLSAKKLGVLIPLSNDWIRRADGRGNQIATLDATNIGRLARDLAYLRGAGSSNEPEGLLSQAGTTLSAATAGSTELENATTDIMAAMFNVANSDVERIRPAWYMSVREEFALRQIRTSDGNFAFAPEMRDGTLMGVPYYSTTQIPYNLDTTGSAANDETDLYFVETSQVIVGMTLDMNVETLENASYNDGSAERHGSQRDESLLRLLTETDIRARHPEGIAVVREIDRGTNLTT